MKTEELQGGWNDVTESLPKESKTVLVCTNTGLIDCMWFSDKLHWHVLKEGQVVTHWMDLPLPPYPRAAGKNLIKTGT